jgi:hypothetical protein
MAIVLIGTIFLPLSQCSQHDADHTLSTAQALAHARHLFPRSDNDFQYQYAIKVLDFSLSGVVTLIAFAWPLASAILSRRRREARFSWIFHFVELLLCAGTIYWISALTLGGRWLYGAYVGEVAISVYACTSLIFIVDRLRNRFRFR